MREFMTIRWMLNVVVAMLVAGCENATDQPVDADLTIYLSGELLERGGVVIVYPLPVTPERWRDSHLQGGSAPLSTLPPADDGPPISPTGQRMTVLLDRQFNEVQFLHPPGRGKYRFRFRAYPASPSNAAALQTRLLSIGGIDTETGVGEAMQYGFTGMPTSGTQSIQVIAPQTTERAARTLMGLRDRANAEPLNCATGPAVSVCTYPDSAWPAVVKAWEIETAELEKEYRRMEALDRCYRAAESAGRGAGSCHLVSDESAEAVYEYRENPAR